MALQLVLEFEGVSEDDYWAVNEALGMPRDLSSGWPDGILTHTAGHTEDGTFVVTEVWESKEAQGAFMESRLGEALAKGGVSHPTKMTWIDLFANVVV